MAIFKLILIKKTVTSGSSQIDLDKGHDPVKAYDDLDRGLIRIEASYPDRGPI